MYSGDLRPFDLMGSTTDRRADLAVWSISPTARRGLPLLVVGVA